MSVRPRLLDLFCGAGGCAVGYHRAGFEVIGVDHEPQPHYPFEFIQLDAMTFLDGRLMEPYSVIHASPPCQAYSAMSRCVETTAPQLVDRVRLELQRIGLPYVIENVEGAPMKGYVVRLCGTMFGLAVRRHRLFEVGGMDDPPLMLTPSCSCRDGVVTGRLVGHRVGGKVAPGRRRPPAATESRRREAIGVPWMTGKEARQAIPPAYTEFIGKNLIRQLTGGRRTVTTLFDRRAALRKLLADADRGTAERRRLAQAIINSEDVRLARDLWAELGVALAAEEEAEEALGLASLPARLAGANGQRQAETEAPPPGPPAAPQLPVTPEMEAPSPINPTTTRPAAPAGAPPTGPDSAAPAAPPGGGSPAKPRRQRKPRAESAAAPSPPLSPPSPPVHLTIRCDRGGWCYPDAPAGGYSDHCFPLAALPTRLRDLSDHAVGVDLVPPPRLSEDDHAGERQLCRLVEQTGVRNVCVLPAPPYEPEEPPLFPPPAPGQDSFGRIAAPPGELFAPSTPTAQEGRL